MLQIKLNPGKKEELNKAFKGNRSIVRKEIVRQIEKNQNIVL